MKGGLLRRAAMFLGLSAIFQPMPKNNLAKPEPGIKPTGHFKRTKKKKTPGAGNKKRTIASCKKMWRNWHTSKDRTGIKRKKLNNAA